MRPGGNVGVLWVASPSAARVGWVAMKERITLRLYEQPSQRACCEGDRYCASEDVRGWHFQSGDQIGLRERFGGYLMGRIEYIRPEILEDEHGRYHVAEVWTQD